MAWNGVGSDAREPVSRSLGRRQPKRCGEDAIGCGTGDVQQSAGVRVRGEARGAGRGTSTCGPEPNWAGYYSSAPSAASSLSRIRSPSSTEPRAASARNRVSASCWVTAMVHSLLHQLVHAHGAVAGEDLHPRVRVVGKTDGEHRHGSAFGNQRSRRDDGQPGEMQLASSEVARVVGDDGLRVARDRQLDDMIVPPRGADFGRQR